MDYNENSEKIFSIKPKKIKNTKYIFDELNFLLFYTDTERLIIEKYLNNEYLEITLNSEIISIEIFSNNYYLFIGSINIIEFYSYKDFQINKLNSLDISLTKTYKMLFYPL